MKDNRKTIADVICPKCKSENCYSYSTDEIEFDADGTGHYIFDIHCIDCQKDSRIICNFEYNLTSGIECDHPTEEVCTGKRCPMQAGYDVANCKNKDCIYRTETEKGGVQE